MSPVNVGETIEVRRQRLSSVPRACEGCKIRKVRCDRTKPCANCRAANITCRQPNDKSSRQVQADSVAHLQVIVENLAKRLQTVESRLATFEQPQSKPNAQPQSVASTAYAVSPLSRPLEGLTGSEGDPSFAAQSLQASESARSACRSDDSGTEHLLHQLQSNIRVSEGLSRSNFFFRKSTLNITPTSQLLPANLATSILQRMHEKRPIFLSSYAISDLSFVEGLFQKVYSTTELASPGDIASIHGVLFYLIKEMIAFKDPLCQKFDLATYMDRCEQIFVAAVETYEVVAVPGFENILALVMGMIKAQGESKPYLYWKLLSAAVTHCQSLNYHRESTFRRMSPQESERVRRLFWTVYTFDKNMSLVLGRVSFMQSLDIDAQRPKFSSDRTLRAWDESFIMGIRLAEIQGRIFVDLYSPVTMTRDTSTRERVVQDLALVMEKWYLELKHIDPEGVNGAGVYSLSRGNWEILFYSTQTLLFHACSALGGEIKISAQCFAAAQSSLRAHLDVFPRYQEAKLLSAADYCNWILLSSSFVPFIVTFLHAIAAKDNNSITLMEQVFDTLQTFRTTSRGYENLYQICSTFTQVAKKLVSSQHRPQDSLSVSDIVQNSALFEPECFQDAPSEDYSMHEDGSLLDSVYTADILNEWLSGPPFPWERLDMEPANL